MYHNDYTVLVREYLSRYNEFKAYVANLEAEIKDYKEMLALSAAPSVPSLSQTRGCGGSGETMSQQERSYFERETLEQRLRESYGNLLEMQPRMNKLDRALASIKSINPVDYRIITARYIDGSSWESTARYAGASVTYCRSEAQKALRRLTGAMFGANAIPIQMRVVFIDDKNHGENCG